MGFEKNGSRILSCHRIGGEMMTIKPFKYFSPTNIRDALSLLNEHKGGAKIIAGGTDLMVALLSSELSPKVLIDIGNIKELDGVRDNKDALSIGALTTHSVLVTSQPVKKRASIISEAARLIGSKQIRNRGTIGGNLVNASPAADLAPPLLALNARVKLVKTSGERVVPIHGFFTGVNETVLGSDELLTEIQIPHRQAKTGAAFIKIGRRSSFTLSVCCVAACITVSKSVCEDVRLAMGAVDRTPIRAVKAESFLKGKTLDEEVVAKAAEIASDETQPISDVRSTAAYRKSVAKVLVKRAIEESIKAA